LRRPTAAACLALLARYPKSGYLPSALFWLGNAQYATRDYKEAVTNFRILLQAAPDHVCARPRRCCRSPIARSS
jgi:TolA-binding protein